jgi:hypothetical protein
VIVFFWTCGPLSVQPLAAQVGETKAVAVEPWSFQLGLDQVFETNVRFDTQGVDDYGTRLNAAVGKSWMLSRGNLRFGATATQLFYRQSTDLNTLFYNVGAGGSYHLTRRLAWSLSGSRSTSYAQDTTVPVDAGLVFPKALTYIDAAATQLTYDLSARTHFTAGASGQSVSFDTPALKGSSAISVGAVLSRQVTRSQTVGVSWGHTFSNGISGDIQGLLGTWQVAINNRLRANFTGGIRPYTLEGQGYQITPGGSASLTAKIGQAGAATCGYERAVEQAYGFEGTHLADRVVAGYSTTVGRRLALNGTFNWGLNKYPEIPNSRLLGRNAATSARYFMTRTLTVGAGYSFWDNSYANGTTITNTRMEVSLIYAPSWR